MTLLATMFYGIRSRLRRALELMREFYLVPYRGALARAKRQEEDLFMLLVYSEMLGVPNAAGFHTLELQPLLYESFHDWHTRMGMDHSPLEWFRCC